MKTSRRSFGLNHRQLLVALSVAGYAVSLLVLPLATFGQNSDKTGNKSVLEQLPEGWRKVREINIPPAQLPSFSKKLGGKIISANNAFFTSNNSTVQINTLVCDSIESAGNVHDNLVKLKSNHRLVSRQNKYVYELVATTPEQIRLANRARYELGFQPKTVLYQVEFQAAPLASTNDSMALNPMFNYFLQYDQKKKEGSSTAQLENAIGKLKPEFNFATHAQVRSMGQGDFKSTWKVEPGPVSVESRGAGELTTLRFGDLPEKVGLPVVTFKGKITSQTYAMVPATSGDTRLFLAATNRFPSNDVMIRKLAEEIITGCKTRDEKTRAILDWLLPGKNLKYGGPITGSRYGTLKVLEQKFGHCWDFSDVFVTLCRAVGIPARQVTGWLFGTSGHVWAEVLIDGQGWQAVDPTSGLQCGSDYIPFMSPADGELGLLYLSDVVIQPVTSNN